MQTHLDNRLHGAHPGAVKRHFRTSRVGSLIVALTLVSALVVHAAHSHDATPTASQLHATCVVCQLGAPVAAQPAVVNASTHADPVCHLSIADRDQAIPPARVAVDLSRAPPASFAL
jgi:hypothetical protein